ncbi:tautomerase family protein [Streptomyces sp. NEAU-S77]|uniref:tautomerase family protein n=1 Tax=Streptomyces sp. NEAU-S77 TaxID=3411033 RepID=UPI003BA28BE4
MPVFQVHVPAGEFSPEQKRALGRALPLALHQALGIPVEDQFVSITGHGPDELFLDPGYMDTERSGDTVIITVLLTAERPCRTSAPWPAQSVRRPPRRSGSPATTCSWR